MDLAFEYQWRSLLKTLSAEYGSDLDLNAILFLIGVQELGQGARVFKKREKLELMHIAVCTLLHPYGYYNPIGRDIQGWPHFEKQKALPPLSGEEQERLMKEAIIAYFYSDDHIGSN